MHSSTEIRALTGLRGVAAAWVVLYHLCQMPGFAVPALQPVLLRGYLAVDLFFVLSGFVLSLAYGDWFAGRLRPGEFAVFLARRLARIWPLHAAVLLVVLGWQHATGSASIWPKLVAANLLLVQAWGVSASVNVPSWSVSTELAAYLLFPLAAPLVLRGGRNVAWLALAAAVTLLGLAAGLNGPLRHGELDIAGNWSLLPLLRCLGGFTVGMLAYRVSRSRAAAAVLSEPRFAAATGATLAAATALQVPDFVLYPLFPVLVASLAAGPGGAASLWAAPPLHWLGVVSYALYLVHYPVMVAAAGLAEFPPAHPMLPMAALVLAAAWVAHVAVERPGRRLAMAAAGRFGLRSQWA